jgi:hypothetical protein
MKSMSSLAAVSLQRMNVSQAATPYARRLHIPPADTVLEPSADMRLGAGAVLVQVAALWSLRCPADSMWQHLTT